MILDANGNPIDEEESEVCLHPQSQRVPMKAMGRLDSWYCQRCGHVED